MNEALLRLAYQAGWEDHTAQPVLGDAVLESGWYDERVMHLVLGHQGGQARVWWRRAPWPDAHEQVSADRLRGRFLRHAAKPDRKWCRAVYAVMFVAEAGWQDSRWEGVDSSWSPWVSGLDPWLPRATSPASFLGVDRAVDNTNGRVVVSRISHGEYQVTLPPGWGDIVIPEPPRPLSPEERIMAAAKKMHDDWARAFVVEGQRQERTASRPVAGLFAPSSLRVNRRR